MSPEWMFGGSIPEIDSTAACRPAAAGTGCILSYMKANVALTLLLIGLALTACRPRPPATAAITAIPPSATPSSTPTAAPSPTHTLPPPTATSSPQPTATATPQPTATPTPAATPTPTLAPLSQQILIEDADDGGDGGDLSTFYGGRSMPRFILYMDGRLLVREWELFDDPHMNARHYQETTLTSTEMCALLQAVQATGFLTVEGGGGYTYAQDDPIYEFGDFSDFSEGAPFSFITVNGPAPRQVQVYAPYWPYVVAQVSAMRELLDQTATQATTLYEPERVVLWIEKGRPDWLTDSVADEPWPEGLLPPLSQLVVAAGDDHRLLVEDGVGPLLEAVDHRMKNSVFLEAGEAYWVLVRQLLPHETPDEIPSFIGEPQRRPLPFDCPL